MEKINKIIKENYFPIAITVLLFLFTFVILNLTVNDWGNYRHLANSFWQGRLNFNEADLNEFRLIDLAYFKNKFYYPLGVLPAILLMPLIKIFGFNLNQSLIAGLITVISFLLIIKICSRRGLNFKDSIWLGWFYIFGSAFYALALKGGVFDMALAHLVATLFMLLGISEYVHKKRWPIIGLMIGLAALARPLIILAIIVFMLDIIFNSESLRQKIFSALKLLIPASLCLLIMMTYNYARFGNPLEAGYRYQLLETKLDNYRQAGVFSLKHIPANLYLMFIKTPDLVTAKDSLALRFPYLDPGKIGLSIFFTSPLLLMLFKAPRRKKIFLVCFAGVILIMLGHLIFFGTGYAQYGYRFAFDYFPLLLLILIEAIKPRLNNSDKLLILAGLIINFWLIFTSSYITTSLIVW